MNEFDNRYYPLKRAFPARAEKFRRDRDISVKNLFFNGKMPVVKHIGFPSPQAADKGKKILFVSDWHWHDSPHNRELLDGFSAVAEKIAPDYLLLGGDISDDAIHLDKLPTLLKRLASLAPVVISANGNWEAGKKWLPEDFFAGLYAENGIIFPENSSFTHGSFRFHVLPDISSIDFRILPKPEKLPGITDILLTHSPDGVIAADKKDFLRDFALAFCGHTHGGQIRLPILGAVFCPSFYRTKFDRGIFSRKGLDLKMIVSAGIGEHCHTRRFLCPPECISVEFI